MIIIIYGTTAELIKMIGLIREFDANKVDYITINTNWQAKEVKELIEYAGFPEPTISLTKGNKGKDITSMKQAVPWLASLKIGFIANNQRIRKLVKKSGKKPLVMVHGDTVTTPLGALWGRLQGYRVAHVEAGLRSHDWRNPFPEEIDRRIATKLCRVHFAPGKIPISDLKKEKVKGDIIDTGINTVYDAMILAKESVTKSKIKLPKSYGLVSIHRVELLSKPDELRKLLELVNNHAKAGHKLIFIDHPVTYDKINELDFNKYLSSKNITRIPKQKYFDFIQIVSKSDYIVTDSGGLQEEAAYLNIPCLVHRIASERQEGIGENVILSKYDGKIVKDFLAKPSKFRGKTAKPRQSPSGIIMKYLKKNNYV